MVGKDENVFNVHEDRLFEVSPFFKAAFESKFREATNRSMSLPEDDTDVVEQFVQWVYFGTLDYERLKEMKDLESPGFELTFRLYVFADKYDLAQIKSLICKDMFKAFKGINWGRLDKDTLTYVYQSTVKNDLLRTMIKDALVWKTTCAWYEMEENLLWLHNMQDLAFDVTVSLAKRANGKLTVDPFTLDFKQYCAQSGASKLGG